MILAHGPCPSAAGKCVATGTPDHEYSGYHYKAAAMEKIIQATEANRHFSRILREVAEGDSFTRTSHGR